MSAPPHTEPALELDDLRKSYGDREVLAGLSLRVGAGEIYGFVGANGSGKTTTMRIALGVLDSDGGEVRHGGRPVDGATRRRFGYMPEERGLYAKDKVGDQLRFLARLHGVDAAAAARETSSILERLDLADRADDKLEELSLGNQQRVQLAAALVHRPDALVLDEPFSGLDPVAVRTMSEVLREHADRGANVVFSSHQLELVEKLCDRVGILHAGRIHAEGTIAELQALGPRRMLIRGAAVADQAARAELLALSGVRREVQEARPGEGHAGHEAGPAGDAIVLELEPETDEQELLQVALRHGPVRAFAPDPLPLSDLFQEVISR